MEQSVRIVEIDSKDLITPCFILDEQAYINNINNFKTTLNKYFEKNKIGYSFKTNSLPRLLKLAHDNGCFAEVVSDDEYLLAERIGFKKDKIIFNGPVKGKEKFLDALHGGSIINIDSKREMDWLRDDNYSGNVGIRVNFDLESKLPGETSTGKKGGRFGFCYENGELHKAIMTLREQGVEIERLHMHVSNASKSSEIYECLAEMACKIIDEEKLPANSIDFGGGYFGGGDDGEAYEVYISKIYNKLKQYDKDHLEVVVEPGASVVATAFSYVSSVVDKKDTEYGRFVITDGSRLHIDPFMVKSKYNVLLPAKRGESIRQTICGYTCMEKDRIMDIETPELKMGDLIKYNIAGSYTMCFNSLFISYLPRVYSKLDNGRYVLVREKWSTDEFLQKCRWYI